MATLTVLYWPAQPLLCYFHPFELGNRISDCGRVLCPKDPERCPACVPGRSDATYFDPIGTQPAGELVGTFHVDPADGLDDVPGAEVEIDTRGNSSGRERPGFFLYRWDE